MILRRQPRPAAVGTYTSWSWPPVADGYHELAWDLEPRTDPSPVGYFWSHQVWLKGGEAAYFGLQTMGSEPTGKIAIFSLWGATDAEGPQYAASFGGEGTGMSVRAQYPWVPGQAEHLALRSEGSSWWAAYVGSQFVGRLRAPQDWGPLSADTVMWTERYGPTMVSCADIGHSVAWFSTPAADGAAPSSHRNHLADNRGCPGSSVTDQGGGVLHVVGAGLSS